MEYHITMKFLLSETNEIIDEDVLFAYLQLFRFLSKEDKRNKKLKYSFYLYETTIEKNKMSCTVYDKLIQGDLKKLKISVDKNIVNTLGDIFDLEKNNLGIYGDVLFEENALNQKEIILGLGEAIDTYITKFMNNKLKVKFANILPPNKQIDQFNRDLEEQGLLNLYGQNIYYKTRFEIMGKSRYLPLHTLLLLEQKNEIDLYEIYSSKDADSDSFYLNSNLKRKDKIFLFEDGNEPILWVHNKKINFSRGSKQHYFLIDLFDRDYSNSSSIFYSTIRESAKNIGDDTSFRNMVNAINNKIKKKTGTTVFVVKNDHFYVDQNKQNINIS